MIDLRNVSNGWKGCLIRCLGKILGNMTLGAHVTRITFGREINGAKHVERIRVIICCIVITRWNLDQAWICIEFSVVLKQQK